MQNKKQDKFNYKNIFSMKNKKVVIFGGTGNLGLNFSKTLSSAGAKVYLLDKIKKKTDDKNIVFSKCDVSSKRSIKSNFERIIKKEKKIDVLIYNVYSKPMDYYQKFEKYNLKTWEKVMETNLTGVFAAGDIVRGASLVVWAIKDGRDVAQSIQKYLENKNKKNIIAA